MIFFIFSYFFFFFKTNFKKSKNNSGILSKCPDEETDLSGD